MKKWYEEHYVSRRDWILENLYKLQISAEQAIIILMIDYRNQYNAPITLDSLAEQTGRNKDDIDRIIAELNKAGYLKIATRNKKVVFDISNVFEEPQETKLSGNLFEVFESEFGRVLSQLETTTIAEWLNVYSEEQVLDALREASIQKKLNMRYIDRILLSLGADREEKN